MFSLANKPFLGIDIGSYSVKLALLKIGSRGSVELLNFGMISLPPDTIVDGEVENPAAISAAIKNLLKSEKIPNNVKYCAFCVSGQSVIIKKITVPLMSSEDLSESIQQEAEQYIPFDIDEVNVDFQIVKAEGEIPQKGQKPVDSDDRQMEVLLVAAKKDVVFEQAEIIRNAGLKPAVVDLDVLSLENGFEVAYGVAEDDTVALVNIGGTFTNVNIVENGVTAYTRDIPVGGANITETIQKNMGVGFRDAEMMKLGHVEDEASREDLIPHIKSGALEITEELKKTFDMFSRTSDSRVRRIYICGGSSSLEGIDYIIGSELGLTCEILNPFRNMKLGKNFDPEYLEKIAPMAVAAVGLAIRRFEDK